MSQVAANRNPFVIPEGALIPFLSPEEEIANHVEVYLLRVPPESKGAFRVQLMERLETFPIHERLQNLENIANSLFEHSFEDICYHSHPLTRGNRHVKHSFSQISNRRCFSAPLENAHIELCLISCSRIQRLFTGSRFPCMVGTSSEFNQLQECLFKAETINLKVLQGYLDDIAGVVSKVIDPSNTLLKTQHIIRALLHCDQPHNVILSEFITDHNLRGIINGYLATPSFLKSLVEFCAANSARKHRAEFAAIARIAALDHFGRDVLESLGGSLKDIVIMIIIRKRFQLVEQHFAADKRLSIDEQRHYVATTRALIGDPLMPNKQGFHRQKGCRLIVEEGTQRIDDVLPLLMEDDFWIKELSKVDRNARLDDKERMTIDILSPWMRWN